MTELERENADLKRRLADAESRLVASERRNANQAKGLKDCYAVRKQQADTLDWLRAMLSNKDLSPSTRIFAAVARLGTLDPARVDTPEAPDTPDTPDAPESASPSETDDAGEQTATGDAPDVPAGPEKLIWLEGEAERAGLSGDTAGKAFRNCVDAGLMRQRTVRREQQGTGKMVPRYMAWWTPEGLAHPEAVKPPVDLPKHGGKRTPAPKVYCPDCGSEHILVRRIEREICTGCGVVLSEHVMSQRWLNESEPDVEAEAEAETEKTMPQDAAWSPTRQAEADAEKTMPQDAAWWTRHPWYDASRPDGVLSQALDWACGRNMVRASAWMRSTQFIKRWNEGRVVTLKDGPKDPEAFTYWLREAYDDTTGRRHGEIRAVAKALLVDMVAALAPDRGAAADERAADARQEALA